MQKEIDIMFKKIQTLEEEKMRQIALWTKMEKKIAELEVSKTKLEKEMIQQ